MKVSHPKHKYSSVLSINKYINKLQSQFPDVDGSELSALDKEIADVQKQLQESQSHCQRLNSGLTFLFLRPLSLSFPFLIPPPPPSPTHPIYLFHSLPSSLFSSLLFSV